MAEQFSAESATPPMVLVPIAGPKIESMSLHTHTDRPQGLVLGRHESCDLRMPATAESVSRFHAKFRFDHSSTQWRIVDLGSTWGTYLNGVKLTPNGELPLSHGDVVRIEPWTFSLGRSAGGRGMMSTDDSGHSIIRTVIGGAVPQTIREDMLALLLEAAAAIHDATTEKELADRLIDAAVRGSGLPNAAVLRPIDVGGQYKIIASKSPASADETSHFTFSRSLLNAAAEGHAAELSAGADVSQSIVQMNISAALCVPLMLGPSPVAYLYLDARATRPGTAFMPSAKPNATAFCAALGRLAGLSLSNLRRLDIERRQATIEHDLTAAAAAQRWVLPRRETIIGPVTVTGESRPGQHVGGDFFEVIDLGNGRIAIALGDVSGKGVEASVLMTATQGFLHAALLNHRDPGQAVTATNRFVAPRRPSSRFVTLWTAVIDTVAKTIAYVDAGHSYAVLVASDGNAVELNEGGGPPLGVADEFVYEAETIPMPAAGRMAVVSDGIIEQPAALSGDAATRAEFSMKGVKHCLAAKTTDDIEELFKCLIHHAGTTRLADDATGVCARWSF